MNEMQIVDFWPRITTRCDEMHVNKILSMQHTINHGEIIISKQKGNNLSNDEIYCEWILTNLEILKLFFRI